MNKSELKYKLQKSIHPFLLNQMKTKVKYTFKILNDHSQIKEQVIYSVNHTNSSDAPVISLALKNHNYFLVGKQSLNLVDKFFLH